MSDHLLDKHFTGIMPGYSERYIHVHINGKSLHEYPFIHLYVRNHIQGWKHINIVFAITFPVYIGVMVKVLSKICLFKNGFKLARFTKLW